MWRHQPRRSIRHARRIVVAVAALALVAPVGVAGVASAEPAGALQRQRAFADAARRFGVPERVLLAVAYNESRWEQHAGTPSTTGAYGVMALTDVPATDAKGVGLAPRARGLHTLDTASRLARIRPAQARRDAAANIRAGAALLASYARSLDHGRLPSSIGGWYGAIAKYAATPSKPAATAFAHDVYQTIRAGARRTTADGQTITLPADPAVRPDREAAASLHLVAPAQDSRAECPRSLDCDFIPAAYQLNNPNDLGDYGDYDLADRPRTMRIDHIVLHDTEETYPDTIDTFTNPRSYVSAHYVIRSADGHVTQMVPTKDVAWQAGNWYVNMHSIGIEQEGFAVQGATWFTEPLYHASARLVRFLAARYGIPLDRQHIIGHDNVPGITPPNVAGMHWDPGPFWDWGHYMALLGRPILPTGTPRSPVVTVNPPFDTNVQSVRDCEQGVDLPEQSASFVYLHTAPSDSAPLVSDPALHPDGAPGTTCANDWGDKASVGQQFVLAGRSGGWTAIWWDGVKAWFRDAHATTPSSGFVVTPKPGMSSIPVYGRAYPEASAYPSGIPVQAVVPLQYVIEAGQSYVTAGPVPTDYYNAPTYTTNVSDHTDVVGQDRYLQIQLGHRVAFVRAADVTVSPAS